MLARLQSYQALRMKDARVSTSFKLNQYSGRFISINVQALDTQNLNVEQSVPEGEVTKPASQGIVSQEQEVPSPAQSRYIPIMKAFGLSDEVCSQLMQHIQSNEAYVDLLIVETLEMRLSALAQFRDSLGKRIDMGSMILNHPKYLVQESQQKLHSIQRCVDQLQEMQTLKVDFIALVQTYPPMFERPAIALVQFVIQVNKIFKSVLDIDDFCQTIMSDKAHSASHLIMFKPTQRSQAAIDQIEKDLQELKESLGPSQTRTLVMSSPITNLSKGWGQQLKLLSNTLGSRNTTKLLLERPQILRRSVKKNREILTLIISYFYKTENFPVDHVRDMIVNNPNIFNIRIARSGIKRYKRIKQEVEYIPEWRNEMAQWSPADRARVATVRQGSVDVMLYFIESYPMAAANVSLLNILLNPQKYKQMFNYQSRKTQKQAEQSIIENTLEGLLGALQKSRVKQELVKYPDVLAQRFTKYLRYFTAQQLYQMMVVKGQYSLFYMPERVFLDKLRNYSLIFSRVQNSKATGTSDLALRILTQEPSLFTVDPEDVNRNIMELHKVLQQFYGQRSYAVQAVTANPKLLTLSITDVLSRTELLAEQVRDIAPWHKQMTSFPPTRFGQVITRDPRVLRRPSAVKKAIGEDIDVVADEVSLAVLINMPHATFVERYPEAAQYLRNSNSKQEDGGGQQEAE